MTVGAAFDAFLAPSATSRTLADGELVVRHGDDPGWVGRIVEGHVEVTAERDGDRVVVERLGPGDVVGQVSLVGGGPATVEATAVGPVRLDVVPADTVRELATSHPELAGPLAASARERADRRALRHVLGDLLPGADDRALLQTAGRLPLRRVPAGTVLLREGDTGDEAMLVVTGRLRVERAGPDGPVDVARLGRGQVVGERGLLEDVPRTATVSTVRDTVLGVLDRATFLDLARTHPAATLEVTRQIAERSRRPPAAERQAVAAIGVVSVSPRVNTRVLTTRMTDALRPFGTVTRVTAGLVDRLLDTPGVSAVDGDHPAATRVEELLHRLETDADLLLVELGREPDGWSRRALRAVDRVVVVLDAEEDPQQTRLAAAYLADLPPGTTTVAVLDHEPAVERPTGTAARRRALGVDDVLHVRASSPADVARVARLVASRGLALVLGGGGARGFAHLGVQRAMTELGVPIDLVVGASIGAPLAGGIACGLTPDEMDARVPPLFAGMLDYTLPVVSLLKGEQLATSVGAQFDGWDVEDAWIPFRCTVTNLTTSRTEVPTTGAMTPAIRASVSIPGVFPPVVRGDDLLVDGGLLDNLPVDVAASDGRCGTIVAVDVAPRLGPRARGDYGLSVSGWQALRQSLGGGRSEYPGLTAVLMRSMLVGSMANRAEALASADVDLLLELDLRGVGLLAFDDVAPVAATGHELARPLLEDWLAGGGWPPAR